jgi:hypothetical protein
VSLTATNDLIRQAITSRHHLEFDYRGHHRIVIPVALGPHRVKRDWRMRAYQVVGSSITNRMGLNWPKIWKATEISNIQVLKTIFDVPEGYRRGDSELDIDTEL